MIPKHLLYTSDGSVLVVKLVAVPMAVISGCMCTWINISGVGVLLSSKHGSH